MEAQTIQKYVHTSPRKLRLVADMVRKMNPTKALDILEFTPKYAARDLTLAIKTAIANGKKLGMDEKNMVFKKVEVDESSKMRRFRASARGRARGYRKKMAHIKIVLTDDLSNKEKEEDKNNEIEVRTGQSANMTKSTKGGRTGLSK